MAVKGATRKQNRKYEHIKKSAKRRGMSTGRAKEMAARTVNKQKSKSSKAPKTTQKARKTNSRSGGKRR